jgi:hypothetical protein
MPKTQKNAATRSTAKKSAETASAVKAGTAETSPTQERIPEHIKVYVFGGGVAGLTAAHELILRGFEVCLIEKQRALGPHGLFDKPTLGGMARTQYVAITPSSEGADPTQDQQAQRYFSVADLPELACRFLKKYASKEDQSVLMKGFAPLKTKDVLVRFLEEALAEGLVGRSPPQDNTALKKLFSVLSRHLQALLRGQPQRKKHFATEFTREKEAAFGALKLNQRALPKNFKIEDVFRRTYIDDFKERIKKLETLVAAEESGTDSFIENLILKSREALEEVPTGKRNRKAVGRRLAAAYVRALKSTLFLLSTDNDSEDRELRSKLLAVLGGFLGKDGPSSTPDDVLSSLPWRVAEPLIEVLRRLLAGRESDALTRLGKDITSKIVDETQNDAAEGFPRNLGTRRGQGFFPQFWLKYNRDDTTKKLTLSGKSRAILQDAINQLNNLVTEGDLSTEKGTLTDVRIYVQSLRSAPPRDPQAAGGEAASVEDVDLAEMVTALLNNSKEALDAFHDTVTEEKNLPLLCKELRGKVFCYDKVRERLPVSLGQPGLAPWMRNWVRVIVYRPQLPGEHGYRFFPSYYRHVFDTMKRIPLQDPSGQPAGGTVLDNLVSLPQIGIFNEKSAPFLMSWNPLELGDALSRLEYNLRNSRNLHIQSQDLLQFSLRILRYMTSCSQRRAAELEEMSWWDYLEGLDPRTQTRLYHYGEPFKKLVQSSSRVLAALDGAQGDARTCGNTYVQLLTQALVPTLHDNSTLNGPTSEAWLFHWRTHLERLGVKFQHGELQQLAVVDGEMAAQVYDPEKQQVQWLPLGMDQKIAEMQAKADGRVVPEPTEAPPSELTLPVYFVVATDLIAAAQATQGLTLGIAPALRSFAFKVPKQQGSQVLVKRDPEKRFAREQWDRLQMISGIQYFFRRHVNLFDGYIYCVDAEWGLSAICSHLVWQDRPIGAPSHYQSILSVDIGDWNTESRRLKKKAWQCTPEELQEEVLHQLRLSLSARGPEQNRASFVLPTPDWVHIDDSLEYGPGKKKQPKKPARRMRGEIDPPENLVTPLRLRRNAAPYLVPIAGDWKHRPGPEPWDPTYQSFVTAPFSFDPHVWQAPHGGYPVHHHRLVFAGTYLRTFTRLTTMESANESARHAVNAILDHCVAHRAPFEVRQGFWNSPAGGSLSNPYEKGLFPTTPFGDYCRIWNPERNELPDFELLQRQDEQAWREGKAHPWDALGLEKVPSLLTQMYGSGQLLDQLMKKLGSRNRDTPLAVQGLLAALRHLRGMLEVRPPGQPR